MAGLVPDHSFMTFISCIFLELNVPGILTRQDLMDGICCLSLLKLVK